MPKLFAAYMDAMRWLEGHLLTCPSKKFLHIECPGCGFQRSVIFLLKGNVAQSLTMYPATIPMLAFFMFAILHLFYKFRHGAMIIQYSQIGIAIIIAAFYIYKIVNLKTII